MGKFETQRTQLSCEVDNQQANLRCLQAELHANRTEMSCEHQEAQANARALHASTAGRLEHELRALRAGLAQLGEDRHRLRQEVDEARAELLSKDREIHHLRAQVPDASLEAERQQRRVHNLESERLHCHLTEVEATLAQTAENCAQLREQAGVVVSNEQHRHAQLQREHCEVLGRQASRLFAVAQSLASTAGQGVALGEECVEVDRSLPGLSASMMQSDRGG